MGLQTQLNDVSSESLPILLLALLATSFSYFRSLLLSLSSPSFASTRSLTHIDTSTLLSDQSCFNILDQNDDEDDNIDDDSLEKCIVCLSGFKEGDCVSKLSCRHVFHKFCLDGWIDQLKFSCPLCRSSLVSDCRVDRVHRRVTRQLVSWFSV